MKETTEKETGVDNKFHQSMEILITKLQLKSEMLLSCAWAIAQESRRVNISPLVET